MGRERESGYGKTAVKVGKVCFCYERQSCGKNNLKERELSKETVLLEVRKKMEGVKVLLQSCVQIKSEKQSF